MARFGQLKQGRCTICNEEAEVLPADFEDQSGLKGHFCKRHFWDAVQTRSALPKRGNGKKKVEEADEATVRAEE
jgi:pyruvate formate-lyase activating enzyme-like uncharacterized protein